MLNKLTFFILSAFILSLSSSGLAINSDTTSGDNNEYTEDFEVPSENWSLSGWRVVNDGSNSYLYGKEHSWARLEGLTWSDYSMKFKLKIVEGGVHINYRLQNADSGINRYFIDIGNDYITLNKQVGDVFSNNLASVSLSMDGNWHDVEIRGYQGIINVLVDGNLLLVYEDDNYFADGIAAFESLDDSEIQIDDIQITGMAKNDVSTSIGALTRSNCEVGGKLSRDEVWSGEIFVTSTVEVPAGVTLTVESGTTVKFKHYRGYKEPDKRCGLTVSGTLNAVGTPDKQIIFTSDASDPINGDWNMIRLYNTDSKSIIKYAVVEFAQQGINMWNCSPTISHTVVRWNNWEGIYMESYCKALIEYNLIYENGYNGIAMEQYNDATVRYNTIMRSGTHGIHVDASKATVEYNILKENNASGLSVDDDGTLIASYNTIKDNADMGIAIGEGHNTVSAKGNLFSGNGEEIQKASGSDVENIPGEGSGNLIYDYEAPADYNLGYIPGDAAKDRYMYVYPDDETRQIVNKIGKGLGLTWSLVWDGKYIWTATVGGDVYKLDPDTGEIKAHWTFPGPQAWGMTYDGEHLWINDFAEKKVYEMDINGNVLSSFYIPDQTGGAKGIAWDGQCLNIMGWTSSVIYQVDKSGTLLGTIQIQGNAGGGLTWDGSYFWAPGGNGIVKIDTQGNIVGNIYAASEGTWDIAWDGSYLWACQRTNENWQDAKIFKLKILDDSLKTDAEITATPTSSSVLVNGKSVAFKAYNINGYNYFKLRDLAKVLSGTEKQFEVGWDGANNAILITTGKIYTSVGGELSVSGNTASVTATLTSSKVYLNGRETSLMAYNIGGYNYFKLRDVATVIDFGVTWDSGTGTIRIDTTTGYTP